MRPLQTAHLKSAILVPLVLSLAGLAAVFIYSLAREHELSAQEQADGLFLAADRVLNNALQSDTDKLSVALDMLAQDPGLRQALQSANREALLRRSAAIFEHLRQHHGITHFYFSGPDRVNLLRVHQPERFGDRIDRFTTLQAERTGQPAAGLELGPLGTFTLRVVHPWFQSGRLIGYVELGEEIEHLLKQVKQTSNVDLHVAIFKQYLSEKEWLAGMKMLGRSGEWNLLPRSVITFQTTRNVGAALQGLLESTVGRTDTLVHADKTFKTRLAPLRDAQNREVGRLLLMHDATPLLARGQRQVLSVATFGLAVGGFLFLLLYLTVARIGKWIDFSRSALVASEGRFRALVESSSDWIWEVDAQGRYVYSSPKVRDLLGYEPRELLGKTPFDFMPPEEAQPLSRKFATIVAERRPFTNLRNVNLRKDGRQVVLETSGVPILDDQGQLLGYRGVDRDITDREQAEEALHRSLQRLSLHFSQTPLGVIEWDPDFKVVEWNPAAERIFGYSRNEALGRPAMDLILPESAKTHVADIWDALLGSRGGHRSTNENVTRDGKIIYCEWYNTPLVNGDGRVLGVSSLVEDVTEQKRNEERLNFLAYYDELTGLANRALFADRLSQAIIEADRHERLIGVLLMDLDHFKNVNDTLGHAAGDQLLKSVAKRLKDCFREGDTIGRFGGDEFAVALADMGHVDDAAQVAQKVLQAFQKPFEVAGTEFFISFSIGITLYPFDDSDIAGLLRNADSAMYQAKAHGRNNFQFYSAEMTRRAEKRMHLEIGLRHALARQEFVLHYQPQIDLKTGELRGVEALIRWQQPEQGMIFPAEFIGVAEETGLIGPIGEWVLRTACQQAQAWRGQGKQDLLMSVNLSARQFRQGHLVAQVLGALQASGLPPRLLELEITESLLIDDADSGIATTLAELKKLGISLAIDDFGTGYSSLSYLKRFPIDRLKIDRSFIVGLDSSEEDASLVNAIIAMARSLDLSVIAEGVDTAGQIDYLRRHGCEQMQGYFFSRPVPASELEALLRSGTTLYSKQ